MRNSSVKPTLAGLPRGVFVLLLAAAFGTTFLVASILALQSASPARGSDIGGPATSPTLVATGTTLYHGRYELYTSDAGGLLNKCRDLTLLDQYVEDGYSPSIGSCGGPVLGATVLIGANDVLILGRTGADTVDLKATITSSNGAAPVTVDSPNLIADPTTAAKYFVISLPIPIANLQLTALTSNGVKTYSWTSN